MCLIIDRREHGLGVQPNDRDRPLYRYNIPIEVAELPFGDCAFLGNGPEGDVMVGIERKKLGDLVTCMKDRRLSGFQLQGLNETYEFVYLVVEGLWRPGPGGEIETFEGQSRGWRPYYNNRDRMAVNYRQVSSYLHSLSLRAITKYGQPWRVMRTAYSSDTAAEYASLYLHWTEKKWSEHRSHDQIFCGHVPAKGHGAGWAVQHTHDEDFTPGFGRVGVVNGSKVPTTLLRMAMQLPGIDARAAKVADQFRTVRSMALAGLDPGLRAKVERWYEDHPGAAEKAWQTIEGVGPKISSAAVRAIVEEGA